MFCKKCGIEASEGSNFCTNCGQKILSEIPTKLQEFRRDFDDEFPDEKVIFKRDDDSIIEVQPKIQSDHNFKPGGVVSKIINVIIFIFAFIIGRFLGIIVFIFIFAYLIGIWFPKWYIKRSNYSIVLIKWIAWTNILSWLLPPIGIFTGFATLGFSDLIEKENKKYKVLAILGIGLSIMNAIFGIIINIDGNSGVFVEETYQNNRNNAIILQKEERTADYEYLGPGLAKITEVDQHNNPITVIEIPGDIAFNNSNNPGNNFLIGWNTAQEAINASCPVGFRISSCDLLSTNVDLSYFHKYEDICQLYGEFINYGKFRLKCEK